MTKTINIFARYIIQKLSVWVFKPTRGIPVGRFMEKFQDRVLMPN